MSITDNDDINIHYQQNTSNPINISAFPEQPLSSDFDNYNNNIGSSMSMSLSMNNDMNSSMNSIDLTNLGRNILGNKLVAKRIRGRSNRDFKELITNL